MHLFCNNMTLTIPGSFTIISEARSKVDKKPSMKVNMGEEMPETKLLQVAKLSRKKVESSRKRENWN